jgi:hypothetical protein
MVVAAEVCLFLAFPYNAVGARVPCEASRQKSDDAGVPAPNTVFQAATIPERRDAMRP